jgi:hypothetical protein
MNEERRQRYMDALEAYLETVDCLDESGCILNDAGGYGMAEYGPHLSANQWNLRWAKEAGFETEAAWRTHNTIALRNAKGGKRGRPVSMKNLVRRRR